MALPRARPLRYLATAAPPPSTRSGTPPNMSDATPVEPSFEEALAELEALVDQLERGDLSLQDSLRSFERGVALTAICQRALSEAEQRVEILTGKDADAKREPFDGAD